MPTLLIEGPTPHQRRTEIEGEGSLLDVCDEIQAPIPFACRSTNCGACRVEILEGHNLLAPPEEDERNVLRIFGDCPSRVRLACSAQFVRGSGMLHLRPAFDTDSATTPD